MDRFRFPTGWLTGRRGILRFFRVDDWAWEKVAMVVAAIVIGGILSSLLSALIKEEGWTGAFTRHTWRAVVYLVVVVVCAIVTTVVVVR